VNNIQNPLSNTPISSARENGLLVNAPRKNLLRFMLALNIGAYEIDDAIAILDKTIEYAFKKHQPA
jgi:acetylornithine/succinyldiaminopimelate/putrescine aminotransferase